MLCKKNAARPQDLPGYSHTLSRHVPAMVTAYVSVQLLGFDLFGSLAHTYSLHDSCSSGQRFALGFLQIRGYPGHPCL